MERWSLPQGFSRVCYSEVTPRVGVAMVISGVVLYSVVVCLPSFSMDRLYLNSSSVRFFP